MTKKFRLEFVDEVGNSAERVVFGTEQDAHDSAAALEHEYPGMRCDGLCEEPLTRTDCEVNAAEWEAAAPTHVRGQEFCLRHAAIWRSLHAGI